MKSIKKIASQERLSFEKARFNYCSEIYQREHERKETLEKKAQFLLSLNTLILGTIFLRMDILEKLRILVFQIKIPPILLSLLYTTMVVLGLAIIVSLMSTLFSMRLQKYKSVHPDNIVSSLFAPDSAYLEKEDEASLLAVVAMNYAIALEFNKELNDKKSIWIGISSLSVFIAVICLSIVLAIVATLLISF